MCQCSAESLLSVVVSHKSHSEGVPRSLGVSFFPFAATVSHVDTSAAMDQWRIQAEGKFQFPDTRGGGGGIRQQQQQHDNDATRGTGAACDTSRNASMPPALILSWEMFKMPVAHFLAKSKNLFAS